MCICFPAIIYSKSIQAVYKFYCESCLREAIYVHWYITRKQESGITAMLHSELDCFSPVVCWLILLFCQAF